jgi:glycosyltransferase involved in cell wall biosynthesis
MSPEISVIICTHNPRIDYLNYVLDALRSQSLAFTEWELLVIDNASQQPLTATLDLTWHPQAQVICEERLGLTNARLRGYQEAQGDLLVYVDDDNVLDPNYLAHVSKIFADHSGLGAIAGRSVPQFEREPAPWIQEFSTILALRDFGDAPLICSERLGNVMHQPYPEFAPAGIGLSLRRQAFLSYVQRALGDRTHLAFGRTGKQLTSGEDNDIILTLLNAGWDVGYFPQLQLTHLIPVNRLQQRYLARLNRATCRSWVQVLAVHGIQIWQAIAPWTVLPRQIKAFITYQAWKDAASYIRWRGACGTFEGLAQLHRKTT